MATFSNIALQEPSTVTARVATVVVARGSTNEQQEILVLGDQASSLGIARVRDVDPSSTDWALAVRQVGWTAQSTTVQVSSLAGRVTVAPTDTNWASSAGFHFDGSGNLQVVPTVLPSTQVTIGSFASLVSSNVQAGNSSALTVRNVWSSTNADQPVSATQSGTWNIATVTAVTGVSSLAGIVAVRPSDTAWASSAGFHFDSSGALQIAGSFAASTTVNVSSLAGRVTVAPSDTAWASSAGFHFDSSGALQIAGTFNAATSTVITVSQLLDSSGGSVTAADSANNAIRVNVVAGAAGGSTIVTISTVQGRVGVAPTDTNWASSAGFHFNSSGELLTAGGGAAGSTIVSIGAFNSLVSSNVQAGNSSALTVRNVWSSTNTDQPVSAAQAGTWNIGTITTLSSLAGIVAVRPSDTNWASSAGFHFNSSGEVLVKDATNSTDVRVSNLPLTMSTTAPATGDTGVIVRQVGFVAYSTDVRVSPLSGSTWKVGPGDTNWASSAGFHFNSSGELLTAGASAAGSTTVNVSSLAGRVTVAPSDTNWASSAGFHFNSSGELQTTASISFTGSTDVTAKQGLAAGSSLPWSVRPSDGSTWVPFALRAEKGSTVPTTSSAVNGPVLMFRAGAAGAASTDVFVPAWASSAGNQFVTMTDAAGVDVEVSTTASANLNSTRRGFGVRQLMPLSTWGSGAAASSGNVTVISSVTGQAIYVYAVTLAYPNPSSAALGGRPPSTALLQNGAGGGELYRAVMTPGSTNVNNAVFQLCVSPPAYLFRTGVGNLLNLNASSSGVTYSVYGWTE